MKQVHLLFLCVTFMLSTAISYGSIDQTEALKSNLDIISSAENLKSDHAQDFLDLTPKKIREITGKKMSLKEIVALKLAQRKLKKQIKKGNNDGVSKTGYIIMAILGLGFIGVGLMTNWEGKDWWVCLLLSFVCIGGLIYALVKMKDYYA